MPTSNGDADVQAARPPSAPSAAALAISHQGAAALELVGPRATQRTGTSVAMGTFESPIRTNAPLACQFERQATSRPMAQRYPVGYDAARNGGFLTSGRHCRARARLCDLLRIDGRRGGAPRVANVGQDRGGLIVAQLPCE